MNLNFISFSMKNLSGVKVEAFPSHNLHRMYDLLRPSPYRLIIDHRTFSFFTYTLTNALALGKLFFFFYIGPATTLFSQTFESPAKTESVVRGRLRHCSRLGLSLRADVTFSLWRSHPISHLK